MSTSGPQQADSGAVNPPAGTRRRLLLVEDHPIVSSGLAGLINYEPDLEVCGIAEDRSSALRKVGELKPDLVILDMTLKGVGGVDFLKDLKSFYPKQRVLMLSMHDETLYAPRALRAGASGYVMKQEPTEVLFIAIRQVLEGGTFLSPKISKQLMNRFLQAGSGGALDPLETLTDRELEVFRLIGQGKTTREIATLLSLSPKTIESHRATVRDKLNLPSGKELRRQAVEMQQALGDQSLE